jgi:hypothetical protein
MKRNPHLDVLDFVNVELIDKMEVAYSMMRENIGIMNNFMEGFDVIIVCCSSGQQARYWQRRLEDGRYILQH